QRLQVDLGRLVRAVLGPHRAVHRELGRGRFARKGFDDTVVFVFGEAESGGLGDGHSTDARTARFSKAPMTAAPSPLWKPTVGSTACSGCGIIPSTFPASLQTPAIAPVAPFGFDPSDERPSRSL